MERYFRYFLLFIFFVAVFIIVFLQYNSNRSINELINGNEKLLSELRLKNSIQELRTSLFSLESKVRGSVLNGEKTSSDIIDSEIKNIYDKLNTLNNLHSLKDDYSVKTELNRLVAEKIHFNESVVQLINTDEKEAILQLTKIKRGRLLMDSIKMVCSQIDNTHQQKVTALISRADSNGNKAKALGLILAAIAAIFSLVMFGYITYKMRQQRLIIARLNASEKQAREAVIAKENFLANMSHEIRTPMNAILGFTELLKKEQLAEKPAGFVNTIHESGEKLLNIVNDILDFSKIEAGMLRIEHVPFNIKTVIKSVEELLKEKAKEKQLSLEINHDASLPETVSGDPVRLSQILVNLAGNAIKFTEPGGTVKISTKNKGINNNTVRLQITVSDNGIGIDSDKLPQIFDRFQQAENSLTRKYGGTGLGLAIVKDLIELKGGSIQVSSKPGSGSDFVVEIPYKIVAAHKTEGIPTNELSHTFSDRQKIRILVVEDNETNCNLLTYLFEKSPYEPAFATTGRDAIDLLQKNHFSLVLMDIQMPEMDGYTVAQKIRKELKMDIPIIAMTAHAFESNKQKSKDAGMDGYISKPINEKVLFTTLEKYADLQYSKLSESSMPFKYIDLQYLKEISMGNTAYEKTVTRQFIQMVPQALTDMKLAFSQDNLPMLKKLSHELKTTISVMGMNAMLNPLLDEIEYKLTDRNAIAEKLETIYSFCTQAVNEATVFVQDMDRFNG